MATATPHHWVKRWGILVLRRGRNLVAASGQLETLSDGDLHPRAAAMAWCEQHLAGRNYVLREVATGYYVAVEHDTAAAACAYGGASTQQKVKELRG